MQLSGVSQRSRRGQHSPAVENASQQKLSSPCRIQQERQRHLQRGRGRNERKPEHKREQGKQRETLGSLRLEAPGSSSFFLSHRRWSACLLASLLLLFVSVHRFIFDNSASPREGLTPLSLVSPPHVFFPFASTVLRPLLSLLPAQLFSFFTSPPSSSSKDCLTSVIFVTHAADTRRPSPAEADGFLPERSRPNQEEPTNANAVVNPDTVTAGQPPGRTTPERAPAAATEPQGRPARVASEGRAGRATQARDAAASGEEVVSHSSPHADADEIELYSYRRVGGLTLVHDAAAQGPAAAPAGHRVAARLPPFTQGLLASPFQQLAAAGGLRAEYSREAAAAAQAQRQGSRQQSAYLSAAEECESRFAGASVLLESSGLYGRSYIREFDFCTGETVRQLYLHPALFAEGAAFLWEPRHQELLLVLLTWREQLLLVLHADTWRFIGTLTVDFEGWGLASNLSAADAAAAVALVKGHRAAAVEEEETAADSGPTGGAAAASGPLAETAASGPTTAAEAPASSSPAAAAGATPERREAAGADAAYLLSPPAKKRNVEYGAAVLPTSLQQRLNQQRLWATTGSDVLLELDVLQLLESVRQLPRYAAVAAATAPANRATGSSSRRVVGAAAIAGVVNEDSSSEEAAAAAAGATSRADAAASAAAAQQEEEATRGRRPAEETTAEPTAAALRERTAAAATGGAAALERRRTAAAAAGGDTAMGESAEGWVSASPFDVEAAGRGGVADVVAAAVSSGAAPAVHVTRRVPLRCLGSPLPMLNELEYLPERQSLLANVFGAFVLAEVDVESGKCKSLASFGGLDGALNVRQACAAKALAARVSL